MKNWLNNHPKQTEIKSWTILKIKIMYYTRDRISSFNKIYCFRALSFIVANVTQIL